MMYIRSYVRLYSFRLLAVLVYVIGYYVFMNYNRQIKKIVLNVRLMSCNANVARCRIASKAFDTIFPGLRSINLRCSKKWLITSRSRVSSFKKIYLDLISEMETVESVSISHQNTIPGIGYLINHEINLTLEEFADECLARVSQSLKSLSLFAFPFYLKSNILLLISVNCHNLVNLNLKFAWLSMDNLNPMPTLTSLTLEFLRLEDEHLNQLNKCFHNLQVLNLLDVREPKFLKIHLLNLKNCHSRWGVYKYPSSLTLITPNLITLKIECLKPAEIHVEASMLSHFHLRYNFSEHAGAFSTTKKFEHLRTLWMDSLYISSLLSEFPITKTVENLTLVSGNAELIDAKDSKLTIGKVFMIFLNLSSLCLKSSAWLDVEASIYQDGWESLDGRKRLKRICAYLKLGDPLWAFWSVACMLDQCLGLSEVSLLVHRCDVGPMSQNFMYKCMARWPGLKWRWGLWSQNFIQNSNFCTLKTFLTCHSSGLHKGLLKNFRVLEKSSKQMVPMYKYTTSNSSHGR